MMKKVTIVVIILNISSPEHLMSVLMVFVFQLQVPLPTNELVSYDTYAPLKFAITALNEVLRHELT